MLDVSFHVEIATKDLEGMIGDVKVQFAAKVGKHEIIELDVALTAGESHELLMFGDKRAVKGT